ncbi:MAG: hypothetical protein AAF289_16615 [Cyanobacteria bacterium P01_A01_bin.135]
MRYLISAIALGIALAIAGCGQTTPEPAASPAALDTPAPDPQPEPPPPPEANSQEISTHGIGPAQLGLTLGELKALLGPRINYVTQSPFLADFDAIAVRQGDEILFHVLHLAGEPMTDADVVQGVLTTNPRYQTANGVGVGTSLADAEDRYGEATLSRHTADAALEYVQFERPPAVNISFGTQAASETYAGLYPEGAGEYQETGEYQPDAAIGSVLVICLNETCAGDS